jgi:hypothetical protein
MKEYKKYFLQKKITQPEETLIILLLQDLLANN